MAGFCLGFFGMMSTQWSTDSVASRDRFDYWRDAISTAFVPLDPVPSKGLEAGCDAFRGAMQGLHLPGLRISTIAANGHEVSLTRGGIARQQGSPFFVNLLRRGTVHVMQYGERARAVAGDIYVVDSSAPWSVSFNEPFEMFCIEIGEEALRPRLGASGRLPSSVLSGEGIQVLRNYLGMLQGQPAGELEQLQDLVFEHCVALLARSAAGAAGHAPATRDGIVMRQRILDFIERHLTDPELSPAKACEALRISRSYLFKLLADGGNTFASYVREARLQGCRQALLRHADRPVSQIAHSWGFGEISTFNRLYRNRFGETPRGTRSGG